MLTHIDLFSGIGGFALAAKWAGFKTIVFCEIDEFCQKVLKKRFGVIADSTGKRSYRRVTNKDNEQTGLLGKNIQSLVLIPDIRDFDGTKWQGATLLTGGFPCQPFSVAGQRRGKEDNRYLWPEMFRVIKEARPHWVLGENVAGIVKLALDQVLADLESEGYETGTLIIPACAINAPHRRDRVWIIANCTDGRLSERGPKGKGRKERQARKTSTNDAPKTDSNASDSERILLQGCQPGQREIEPRRGSWEIAWIEVAARFCRVDDGVSDRVHRLKALGNAIVPQVAYEIMKRIVEVEKGGKDE